MARIPRSLEQLQLTYRAAYNAAATYRVQLDAKYGDACYASDAEQRKRETLRQRQRAAERAILEWLEENCAWDYQSGVSCAWLFGSLTADIARTQQPILPVEAASYGMPMREFTPRPR
jgi:hypothetical protein